MVWQATYTDEDGSPFVIFDTSTNECPTSLLATKSTESRSGVLAMDMVMYFVRVRVMKEAMGASPYGGDLNKWPSRLVDAMFLLQKEHKRVDDIKSPRRKKPPKGT